jgi:uncharacterized lipoprotein YddW (UPF0748 family)
MKHSIRLTHVTTMAALLAAAGALGGPGCRSTGGGGGGFGLPGLTRPARVAPRPLPRPVRAVWVARFHYHYADDVRTIMDKCAQAGFNTVLWQVRGEGTVSYPSRFEPWSREYGFADPGFDPLAVAVEEAHKRGLRIEAYFNTTPGWKGKTPPGARDQLWFKHPEWFLHDAAGRPQAPTDFYMPLNPCLPEVRRHITGVAAEILDRYDVDGIHLDYVRYAWDETRNAKQLFPRDARTLALFQRETGFDPDTNPRAWDSWRANQLTRLVSDIRDAVNRRRPGATLTAAVLRDPRKAYDDYLQNCVAWLRAGLVDAVMPMAYSADASKLEGEIRAYRELARGGRIVPGIGIYLQKRAEDMRAQLQLCTAQGGDFALFSYESLFPTAGDRGKAPTEAVQEERQMRRAVLAEFRPH